MPTIEREVRIDAPPQAVFEYVRQPENHTRVIPSLVAVENVEETAVGHAGELTYDVFGIDLHSRFRDVEIDPPNRRVYEVSGNLEGRVTYELEPANGGTSLRYVNEYEPVASGVLGKLARPVVSRQLERETDAMIRNLKQQLE
ncbi:SRPBCC family protein [Haloparvum sp. PAK95]|uniref:SRPBCC family protein n=1 Tax=Haloparvum sp. PAK95 TaxID=3418962 RepID=UPI003D2EF198